MRPDFNVSGLSAAANDRVLSITVDDSQGINSDKATIVLDDRDYKLEWPEQGRIIVVSMGYRETGLMEMGTFEVDEVRHKESQAATLEISANAQKHANSDIKAQRTQPWDHKTLGQIVGEIATRNGYTPEVDPEVQMIYFDHIDQRTESDVAFLQNLGNRYDCFVKYQDGKLMFKPRGKTNGSVTVSKGSMQQSGNGWSRTIGTSISATLNTRCKYKSVRTAWHNVHTGEHTYEIAGGGDAQFDMKGTFESKQAAKDAGAAKLKALSRGTGQIDNLSFPGDPSARAEMDLVVVNFRPEICAMNWIITQATHVISSGGYVTTVKADSKNGGDGSFGAEQSSALG